MGVAAVTSMDNVMMTDDGMTGRLSISRYAFRRIQTPQTYFLGDLSYISPFFMAYNALNIATSSTVLIFKLLSEPFEKFTFLPSREIILFVSISPSIPFSSASSCAF